MTHIRTQIRHGLVGLLTDETAAGVNVHAARPRPNPEGDLPVIFVSAISERSERVTDNSELTRYPAIRVTGFVSANVDTADDVADALALQIEIAVAADPTVNGLAFDTELIETELEFESGEQDMAAIELTYRFEATEISLLAMTA